MTPFTAAKKTTRALAAAIALAGLPLAVATSAMAQPRPPAAGPAQADHTRNHVRPDRTEGRIAYLKAELKITPEQETQWQSVATALRQNANALDQVINSARQQRGTIDAVQRLTEREQFDKVRTESDARLLSAFKPLYASLSPEQQQMANQLLVQHHGWRHRA